VDLKIGLATSSQTLFFDRLDEIKIIEFMFSRVFCRA